MACLLNLKWARIRIIKLRTVTNLTSVLLVILLAIFAKSIEELIFAETIKAHFF